YETHVIRHPWSTSTDASFPSDHASASLAIAFTVLAFDVVAGSVLLAAAALIAVGRLFIGAHYPGDVAASVLVGAASALVVVRVGARAAEGPLQDGHPRQAEPVAQPIHRGRDRPEVLGDHRQVAERPLDRPKEVETRAGPPAAALRRPVPLGDRPVGDEAAEV